MACYRGIEDFREVIYDERRWKLLRRKREKAIGIMERLRKHGIESVVHGSVARGDVSEDSDVDIVIPYPIPPYRVEILFNNVYSKMIIQATPLSAPKVYIYLDPQEEVVISYPLVRLEHKEMEFYKFSGQLSLEDLKKGKRVPGVDKSLIQKIPFEEGHCETPITKKEEVVAKILGISVDTVLERERILLRRKELGRTGVLIKYSIPVGETVEEAIEKLTRKYPHFRDLMRERGLY